MCRKGIKYVYKTVCLTLNRNLKLLCYVFMLTFNTISLIWIAATKVTLQAFFHYRPTSEQLKCTRPVFKKNVNVLYLVGSLFQNLIYVSQLFTLNTSFTLNSSTDVVNVLCITYALLILHVNQLKIAELDTNVFYKTQAFRSSLARTLCSLLNFIT